MRLHLQALAVAPIFIFIVSAFSHSAQPNLRQRDAETAHSLRQYGTSSRALLSRELGGSFLSLEARAPQIAPYRPKPKVDSKGNVKQKQKLSSADQQARKAGKKEATVKATAANKDKRLHWQSLTPADRKKQRLDKPKMPKAPMAKGATQSDKSQRKQAEAKQRLTDRKAAGRAQFAPAKEAYGKMQKLPGRHDTFTAKGGETATGRQVRNAVFNSKYFGPNQPIVAGLSKAKAKKNTLAAPGTFENRPEGPATKKKVPIKGMKGTGTEFPVGPQNKGGYQGGSDNKGGMRVITQGNKFKGVVAHDASRTDPTQPGYMDHFRVQPRPARKPKQGINH
ncbi:hypothetical protein BKA70DRAFT_1286288 [Coprinopsis sp. MPI-PUGE-AT-0042]|nr:hypothetical protein BKA70DRAFT_1286288 [Coprinopsis sp. MPI-PUGE-AT-0042]